MDKLKINLIPPEIKENAKKEAKRSFLVKVSVGVLGLLILFTSGILAVIIFQNVTLEALEADIEQEKNRIGTLRDKEAVVFFLKNRLDTINKFAGGQYKQEEVYELISSLISENIVLASLQIDKTDVVALQGDTNSTLALENFFNNLTDPEMNEGKIASVAVESLSRSQNGKIGFNLEIKMSGK